MPKKFTITARDIEPADFAISTIGSLALHLTKSEPQNPATLETFITILQEVKKQIPLDILLTVFGYEFSMATNEYLRNKMKQIDSDEITIVLEHPSKE